MIRSPNHPPQSCRHAPCAVGRGTESLKAIAICAALSFAAAIGPSPLRAHDSPEHVIEAITATIERSGPTANLLFARAIEHRAMRDYRNAEADLRIAVALDGENRFVAECELINLLVRRDEPHATVEAQALLATMWERHHADTTPAIKGELSALAAAIACQDRDWVLAAKLYGDALTTRDDISWYILRSRAQTHLTSKEFSTTRIHDLREGYAKTHSPVLRRELCNALLLRAKNEKDKRAEQEAGAIIEEELRLNRYRSAWLILRADIRSQQGRNAASDLDICDALAELQTRIHPEHPDVELLIRRARCHLQLHNYSAAKADIRRALQAHAPEWMLWPWNTVEDINVPTVVSPDD